MQDIKYILSIETLLKANSSVDLWERCFQQLDRERLERAKRSEVLRKKAESVGAGLLIQLAVRVAMGRQRYGANGNSALDEGISKFEKLSLSEVLARLERMEGSPLSLEYTYGENGKPYFKNIPLYFNLSHSGEYVCCVLSEQEIGVDIQGRETAVKEGLAQRFFSKEEVQCMEQCDSEQLRQDLFYRLWTRKEAYGKLTGKGLGAVIGENVSVVPSKGEIYAPHLHMLFEEYEIDNYQIAVCKWKH